MTDNEKLALMTYNQPFNPAVPISTNGLTQGDKQHLIWQYPGILWEYGLWKTPTFDSSASWQAPTGTSTANWQAPTFNSDASWSEV